MTFGPRIDSHLRSRAIAAARLILGWTQKDLASHAQISVGAVQNIEAGKPGVRTETLDKVFAALQTHGIVFFMSHPELGSGVGYRP